MFKLKTQRDGWVYFAEWFRCALFSMRRSLKIQFQSFIVFTTAEAVIFDRNFPLQLKLIHIFHIALPIKFIRIFEVLNLFLFIKKFRFKIVLPLVVPRRTAATLHSVSFFIRLPRVRIRDVTLFKYVWIDSEKRKNTTRARCTQTYIHSQRRSSIM